MKLIYHPNLQPPYYSPAKSTVKYLAVGYKAKNITKVPYTLLNEACHVRFDRKTLPKSGKSILNDCFIEKKNKVWLIWHRQTRALLGIANDKNLACKTLEYSERFNNDSSWIHSTCA